MTIASAIELLLRADIAEDPFAHAIVHAPLLSEVFARAVTRLSSSGAWARVEPGAYSLDERRLRSDDLVGELGWIEALGREAGPVLERRFGLDLDLRVDIDVHRMRVGDRIAVHNDLRPNGEAVRLLVQLHAEAEAGGELVLLASPDPATARVLVPARTGILVAFPISSRSYHAVLPCRGSRFTLVYSYYPRRA